MVEIKQDCDLEWDEVRDEEWIDRDSWPLLVYASSTGCLELVRAVLMEIAAAKTTEDERLRCVGDVEIVTLLLEAGADPYIKNEMGLNSFDISDKHGPFPSVVETLQQKRAL